MKIEYFENGAKITDLTLAAALLTEHGSCIKLLATEKTNGSKGQKFFVLAGNVVFLKERINSFMSGDFLISDARSFGYQMKALKDIVHVKNYGN